MLLEKLGDVLRYHADVPNALRIDGDRNPRFGADAETTRFREEKRPIEAAGSTRLL